MIRSMTVALVLSSLAGCASVQSTPDRQVTEARNCDLLLDQARSSFVLFEVKSGRTLVCNEDRAGTRFVPASTFKVAHALIALETGAIENENTAFQWDGQARGVAAWDRDTSLAGAMAPSVVWVFQEVATRIGADQERVWLTRLSYGNAATGGPENLRTFWLSGPLAISAFEQIDFLNSLREGTIEAATLNQARVRAMLELRDCGSDCRVFGKTGAVLPIDDRGFLRNGSAEFLPPGERTGWFVGWVERSDEAGGPVVFAHNLDLDLPGSMASRTGVAYALLSANGVAIEGR